jgi:hypothetical protein
VTGWRNGKMGCCAGPVWEGEMRRGEKSRLTVGNWIKRDKGI